MTNADTRPRTPPPWRGNLVRNSVAQNAWLAQQRPEPPLRPDWPLIDAHQHLMLAPAHGVVYGLDEALADMAATGQGFVGTVLVEAGTAYDLQAPPSLKPVGEAHFARDMRTQSLARGGPELGMALVAHADLGLGDDVAPVLHALQQASGGRLRGIRHVTVHDHGAVGRTLLRPCPPGRLLDPDYQAGVAQVRAMGLVLDVWVFHHQLHEVLALAQRFDDLIIVLNHLGTPLGVAEHAQDPQATWAQWARGLQALARCPNVRLKMGGQGMPMAGLGHDHAPCPPDSIALAQQLQPRWDLALEAFGAARCLCTSNFPIDRQSWRLDVIWNTWQRLCLPLSDTERHALLCGSAAQTYGLGLSLLSPPPTTS